jgi:hypothetical protein
MIDVLNKTYRALIVYFDDRLGSELIKILVWQDLVPALERAHEGVRSVTGGQVSGRNCIDEMKAPNQR